MTLIEEESAVRFAISGKLKTGKLGMIRGAILASVVLIPSLVTGPVGGHTAAHAAAKIKIVYVNPLPTTPDWGRSGRYFEQAASKLGYQATVVGPNTFDIAAMVTDIQDAIASKADVIMTCACTAGAFDAVLKKARAAGIVVVTIAADSGPNTRDVFLGTNYVKLGHDAALKIAKKMNGKANIGLVQTDGTTPNQIAEIKAFKAALKPYPNMKVVAAVYDNSDASIAAPKMTQMLIAHPDINVIWTVEGAAPGVVESVLKQAGKKPGEVTVLAIDLQVPTKQAIQQGWIWATQYQQFFDATPLGAKCALDIKAGKKIKSSVIDTGSLFITKANIPANLPPKDEVLPKAC
jgi:ABC-type sugar transport system substrate-binding protein